MKSRYKIAWAAGVLEADGCIMFKDSPLSKYGKHPRLRVAMGDEDIVRDLQATLGVGLVRGPLKKSYSRNKHNLVKQPKNPKPLWLWEVNKKAHVKSALEAMLPYLHSRRGRKAQQVLNFINQEIKL